MSPLAPSFFVSPESHFEGSSCRAGDPAAAAQPQGLAEARARIDEIDRQLLALLSDRARIALAVAEIKRKAGLPIRSVKREAEVLAGLAARNAGPLPEQSVRRIWERIFEEMRSLEGEPAQP